MRVLIVGCGYVGLPLGAELARQGHEVFGLRRSTRAEDDLKAAGIRPVFGDITDSADLARLPVPFDWVVNCVATSGGGGEEYRRVYLEGTRHLLKRLALTPPTKFVYTSSTSVYAQNDGSVVTETSPAQPSTETGKVLAETEQLLLDAVRQSDFPAVILRVAGIYGPGRGYWFQQYLKNEARIEGNGERILNMIHRDDVVSCVIAALKRGKPGEIYNATDDEPVSQLEFFKWLAATLGRDLPPFVPEDRERRKRGTTHKCVSNKKLRDELGCDFRFPHFREGYRAELLRLERMHLPG